MSLLLCALSNLCCPPVLCGWPAVCKEPPYKVEESGYAGFLMPIEVYFKNKVRGGSPTPLLGNIKHNSLELGPSGPSAAETIPSKVSLVPLCFPLESL